MNYLERTNQALDFIETGLRDELSGGEVAYNTAFSRFHFHRIFLALTGQTIKEYITARRMTEAARELIESRKPIIDIALDYQFETQESFTRAFNRYFGTSPGRYRKNAVHLDGLYQSPLRLSAQGPCGKDTFFFAGTVEKAPFTVAGLSQRCSTTKLDNGLIDLWKQLSLRGNELQQKTASAHGYGVCLFDDSCRNHEFDYLAGVEIAAGSHIPEGFQSCTITHQHYAVFTVRGIHNIVPAYRYFFGTWLKQNDVAWENAPDFEYYDERYDTQHPFESELDLYLPISG